MAGVVADLCETVVALMRRRSHQSTAASDAAEAIGVLEPEVRAPRQRVRRLSDDEVDQLVAGRLQGEEIGVLAERFGVHRNTVMTHLARRSVPGHRWTGRVLSAEELTKAGELYRSGINLISVGEQFGVDRRYLRRALPEVGFEIRHAGQQKQM